MEEVFEHFKDAIISTFKKETYALNQEIDNLKEQVSKLTKLLQEKDEQCRHIATVLQTKNAEWKRIKLKLAENKKQKSGDIDKVSVNEGVNESVNDDIEIVIEQEGKENKIDNGAIDIPRVDSYNNNNDDCTQLPPPLSPRKLQPQAETQSNLDALIDLISDSDGDGDETTDDIDPPAISRTSSFTFEAPRIQKRKSHARGCSCCDKFYSATRSPSSTSTDTNAVRTDSFLLSSNTPPGFWDTSFTPRQ